MLAGGIEAVDSYSDREGWGEILGDTALTMLIVFGAGQVIDHLGEDQSWIVTIAIGVEIESVIAILEAWGDFFVDWGSDWIPEWGQAG